MKFLRLTILLAFTLPLAAGAAAQQKAPPAPPPRSTPRPPQSSPPPPPAEDFTMERRVAAEPAVFVSLCITSGDVVVRGWDRNEVRARASETGSLRLLTPNVEPAPRVEVLVSHQRDSELSSGQCGLTDSLEVVVPRGATVELRVSDGHVEVDGVTEARIRNLSGDVVVRGVSRAVEVSCMSGEIELSDSSGRARLHTVSGSVVARNVRTVAPNDVLDASSTSGDVTLERVGHAQVRGATVSGSVLYAGALARGGVYDFKTTSGDVTMALPSDSSFRLRAKVVHSGEIITDFPVRTAGAPPNPRPAPPGGRKPTNHRPGPDAGTSLLDGTVGAGDAQVSMVSFSGTLHLKRQ
jgi:hypothetical protein